MSDIVINRLDRSRTELASFLRKHRERLSPLEVGLPSGKRRRTPGLRREEVAALAGVGLTWYTWLEQGRSISVSTDFLDNIARILKLDEIERRHLFLLAQQRPPVMTRQTWCKLPPLVGRLLDDLKVRPAYVLNLRWDVIGWNPAADYLFDFKNRNQTERNMLYMLFADNQLNSRILEWESQAAQVLASFRQDYALAPEDEGMLELIGNLERSSPAFKNLWNRHDVHGKCEGRRSFLVEGLQPVIFEHSSFIVDADKHLRLVFYAAIAEQDSSIEFESKILKLK